MGRLKVIEEENIHFGGQNNKMPNLKKLERKQNIEIFCDGTGIPTRESCYCVIVSSSGNYSRKNVYLETKVFPERFEVNKIESLGLIRALEIANNMKKNKKIKVFTDRLILADQIKKDKFINKDFETKVKALLRDNIIVAWVRRDKNVAGWYLESRNKKLKKYFNGRFQKNGKIRN